jgi:hypothetical protein
MNLKFRFVLVEFNGFELKRLIRRNGFIGVVINLNLLLLLGQAKYDIVLY